MVMDFIDISPKDLKSANKILKALDILGISQHDLLRMKEIIDENKVLKDRVEALEKWQQQTIREENERLNSFKKDKDKVDYKAFINDTGVDFNPYATK